MVVAPIAGALADRYGDRPFMALGMALQAVGLGRVALIARADMGDLELGAALTVAGIGTSMCFPTVANAVVGSHDGVHSSPPAFIDRFKLALWVAVGFSAIGVAATLLAPARARPETAAPAARRPALASPRS